MSDPYPLPACQVCGRTGRDVGWRRAGGVDRYRWLCAEHSYTDDRSRGGDLSAALQDVRTRWFRRELTESEAFHAVMAVLADVEDTSSPSQDTRYCSHRWHAPRHDVPESTPVEHVCAEPADVPHLPHRCICGAGITD